MFLQYPHFFARTKKNFQEKGWSMVVTLRVSGDVFHIQTYKNKKE